MKISEIREYSTEELHNILKDKREYLFSLRAQAVTEKLEDPSQIKKTKRDIAKILTVLNERNRETKENKKTKS